MKSTTMTAKAKLAKAAKAKQPDYAGKIARALELQSQIDSLKAEYDEIKQFFHDTFMDGTKGTEYIATEAGVATLKSTNSYSVSPEKVEDLKNIFGTTYPAFVQDKVAYGVTPALKKLLSDADYDYADTIRDAVVIKTTHSVQFTGIKQ